MAVNRSRAACRLVRASSRARRRRWTRPRASWLRGSSNARVDCRWADTAPIERVDRAVELTACSVHESVEPQPDPGEGWTLKPLADLALFSGQRGGPVELTGGDQCLAEVGFHPLASARFVHAE